MYIGPTIIGVATRNTLYSEMPKALRAAIEKAPYLAGLCVRVSDLATALNQIRTQNGAYYNLYKKALEHSAELKGEN
jgi:hypothetical protein